MSLLTQLIEMKLQIFKALTTKQKNKVLTEPKHGYIWKAIQPLQTCIIAQQIFLETKSIKRTHVLFAYEFNIDIRDKKG